MPDKSSLELPAHYVPVIKLKNDKLYDCLGNDHDGLLRRKIYLW